MKPYIQSFDLRWNDLDANRHLANTAYLEFATETRIRFLREQGATHELFMREQLGPVVFSETIHYLREVKPDGRIHVDAELKGTSEDGMFFQMQHFVYDEAGEMCAFIEVKGGWFCLKTRKLRVPPKVVATAVENIPKSADFKALTKEDTRSLDPSVRQRRLDPAYL